MATNTSSAEPSSNKCNAIHTAGASRGNPGAAGAGVVLSRPDGRISAKCYRYLGHCTSNQAEYLALLTGLKRALAQGLRVIVVRSSSELMVNQLLGSYSVNNADLQHLHAAARALLQRFEHWQIEHVPRHRNTEAHRLAHKAIQVQQARESAVAS